MLPQVTEFWGSFRLDPRQPGSASLRASDADREVVRAVLAEAYSDGRLARDEYDDRTGVLFGAGRTLGDLTPLVTDLVAGGSPGQAPAPPGRADLRERGIRKWRTDVEDAVVAFLVPNIVCTVIWAGTSAGKFFWPMFPMLILGLNLLRTVVQRETVIGEEVGRLESRQARLALRREKRAARARGLSRAALTRRSSG